MKPAPIPSASATARGSRRGRGVLNARRTRILLSLSAVALLVPALAGQTHRTGANASTRVVQVEPATTYKLVARMHGAVWVALDAANTRDRTIRFAFVPPGRSVTLTSASSATRRFLIVDIRQATQRPTAQAIFLQDGHELQDASDRNETLLIAVSPVILRDIANRGSESEWLPGKPSIIRLQVGQVAWIPAGTHHLKNLSRQEAKLVAVEW